MKERFEIRCSKCNAEFSLEAQPKCECSVAAYGIVNGRGLSLSGIADLFAKVESYDVIVKRILINSSDFHVLEKEMRELGAVWTAEIFIDGALKVEDEEPA